jgi:hypothetical protein
VAATTVVTPAGGGSVIPAPAGALPISVAEEGTTLTTAVRSFNFVGDGVVAVANTQNNAVTVTITGGNVISNYSNANVAAYLPTNTSNVRGNYFIGNGSLLTGIVATGDYSNSNVAAYLPTYTGNLRALTGNVTTTANISGSYILGNGSQLTGISASSNTIFNGISNVTIPTANGNVIINAGSGNQWTFGTDGILTLAGGATLKEGVTLGALALGYQAGATSQGIRAVAIGQAAGQTSQGSRAVAIGLSAGSTSQGGYAVAIGASAGVTSQGNNSIIINASGSTLDQTTANTFTVAPVRNDTSNTANVMFYNATSKEITYGNTISVAGNITANYFFGDGSQLTGLGATYANSNVASYLGSGTNTSNIITTGNVSGSYILGNGSQLTGLGATYANSNVAAYLPTYTGNLVSLTGNVTTTANITGGNLITSAVVNAGNIVIEAGNNLDLRGGDKISAPGQAGGNINIDAGDGGADNGTIAGPGGSVEISGGPGGTVAAGTPGVGGQVLIGGGMGSGSNVTNARTAGVGGQIIVVGGDGGMANTSPLSSPGGNIEIYGGTGSRSQANAVTGAAGHVNIYGGNWGSTANSGNVTVNTYRPTTQYQWIFDNSGNLTVPGSIVLPPNALITGTAASPAPRLSGFDSVAAVNVSASGNVTGTNVRALANVYVEATNGNLILGDATTTASPGLSSTGSLTFTANRSGTAKAMVLSTDGSLNVSGDLVVNSIRTDDSTFVNIEDGVNVTGDAILSGGLTATGNISGGNLTVGSGTINGGNVNGANFNGNVAFGTGTVGGSGNITGGNLLFGSGVVSGTGNISGGNLNVTGNIVDTGALSIITGSNGNIALEPNGSGIVTASGNISAVGNVSGGNLITGGLVSATGNITATGNISGGNLTITGNTATITSANYSIGYLNIPQVSLSANATTALTDSGKHFYSVSASNLQLTIANNTSVTWPVGTAMTIVNRGTANVLIVPGTGVSLFLAGNSTSANRVVTTYGMATVINVAANIWMINGTVT